MPPMNTRRTFAFRLAGTALLLLASATAIPQQAGARYTVEIVVFRNGGQAAATTAETQSALSSTDDVEPTTVATRKLGGAASRLRAAGGMRVLAHTAWSQGATGWNSRRGVTASRLGIAGSGIGGKVILERGQYLHLGVDLTVEDGGHRYRINEVRRVKPDEIQYFDHPALGVIAVVTAGG
jgi:hypothetical protein